MVQPQLKDHRPNRWYRGRASNSRCRLVLLSAMAFGVFLVLIFAGSFFDAYLCETYFERPYDSYIVSRTDSGAKENKHQESVGGDIKTDDDDVDDPCIVAVERMHIRNDCFRARQRRLEGGFTGIDDPRCSSDMAAATAPVYNYALYPGQGFGRVVEHTVKTCLLAEILHRPCVIDVSPRDRYYTWRSFINVGTYNWDPQIILKNHASNISAVIRRLPQEGKNYGVDDWTEEPPPYSDVLPARKQNDWNAAQLLSYWDGHSNITGHQILISPNWGSAWHPGIRFPPIHGCSDMQKLRTLLQNDMYAPTSLALTLHEERRRDIFGETAADASTIYGAIHLRTLHFFGTYTNEDITDKINQCISARADVVNKWWLIADNSEVADHVSNAIANVYTGYTDAFNEKNKHSYKAKGKFDHEIMAPSVLDWMVLHESIISIVADGVKGHVTAFGETGSRGNGKVSKGRCGDIFTVYEK